MSAGQAITTAARAPAQALPAQPRRRRNLLTAGGIVLLTAAAYLPSLTGGFLLDDERWLWRDPVIVRSAGPRHYWTGREATPDYLPVASTALWAQWRLFGQDPRGYRLVNLGLHAAAAVLVWRCLAGLAVPGAAVAAAAFAVHPVNVASVAWIAEQKNTLSLVLLAGAALSHLRFDAGGGRRWYALALPLFALACLTKVSVMVLPGVLLGCAWWRRGRITWTDVWRVLPLALLAGVLAAVAVHYQRNWSWADAAANAPRNLAERLALVGRTLGFYLVKAVAPARLSLMYPLWSIHAPTAWSFAPLAAAGAAAGLLIWRRRRAWARAAGFGLGCYAAALLPTLGVVNLSYMAHSYVADHWHYLALIPATALAVGAAAHGLRPRPGLPRWAAPAAGAALLAVLAGLTLRRAALFGDNEVLWSHTVAGNPASWAARHNYGRALAEAGKPDEAARQFERVLEMRPRYDRAWYSLGRLRYLQGRPEEAQRCFAAALEINEGYVEPRYGLAMLLTEQGRYDAAVQHWQRLVQQSPAWLEVRQHLATTLLAAGRADEAAAQFRMVLKIDPACEPARRGLMRATAPPSRPAG